VIKIQYVVLLVHGKLFSLLFGRLSELFCGRGEIFVVSNSQATSKAHLNPSLDSLGTTNNSNFHLLSIKFSVFLARMKVFSDFSLFFGE
jgi:hypothetical protein